MRSLRTKRPRITRVLLVLVLASVFLLTTVMKKNALSLIRVLLVLLLASVFLLATVITIWHAWTQCQGGPSSGFLHTFQGELVDTSGCEVQLTGVNWFGFETSAFAPH